MARWVTFEEPSGESFAMRADRILFVYRSGLKDRAVITYVSASGDIDNHKSEIPINTVVKIIEEAERG